MLHARITVTREALEQVAARDRALGRRMGGLSLRHQRKAWGRIQSARWRKVLDAELRGLVADLTVAFNG